MNKNKKKKERITYYDDGRSFADMSGVQGGFRSTFGKGTTSRPKDIWNTYWMAVRMMVKPMFVTIGFLCLIFAVAYIFFSLI